MAVSKKATTEEWFTIEWICEIVIINDNSNVSSSSSDGGSGLKNESWKEIAIQVTVTTGNLVIPKRIKLVNKLMSVLDSELL